MTRRTLLRLRAVAALLLVAGCGDPAAMVQPPVLRSLALYMVLNPDRDVQPVLVRPASAIDSVWDVGVRVTRGGATVHTVAPRTGHQGNCTDAYGMYRHSAECVDVGFRPEPGGTYRVRVTSAAQPEADATVTVPGDFRIVAHEARGTPAGTQGLTATWTSSPGAYRYVVALRTTRLRPVGVPGGWMVTTGDTTITTTVPAEALVDGVGEWVLDVYAMERGIFEFLSTGSAALPFPVPPPQNVRGGYGVVGAWVRRSVHLGP